MSGFLGKEITQFCNDHLQITGGGDDIIYAVCPFCGKEGKHWNINLNTGLWHCYRCKESGSFKWLLTKVVSRDFAEEFENSFMMDIDIPTLDDLLVEEEAKERENRVDLLKDFIEIEGSPLWGKAAFRYLAERDIFKQDIKNLRIKLGLGKVFSGRVVFPVIENQTVKSFTARTFMGDSTRYKVPDSSLLIEKHSSLLYRPRGIDLESRFYNLCICEGVFDAFSIQEVCGYDAVAVMTNTISKEQLLKFVKMAKTATVVLDGGFEKEAVAIGKELSMFMPVKVAVLPVGLDPSKLGRKTTDYIESAVDISCFL